MIQAVISFICNPKKQKQLLKLCILGEQSKVKKQTEKGIFQVAGY